MTGTVTSFDGVPILFEAHGAGAPAIVFVHGWSCDRSYWSGQLEPFSRKFRVVAMDLAGHGESGAERDAWTIASFGEDVASVVGELELERVILVGHSMGGDVICEAARRLPGCVAGLVWVDTYRKLAEANTDEQVESMMAPFRTSFAETVSKFVRGMFPEGSAEAMVEKVVAGVSAAPTSIALAAMQSAFTYDREVLRVLQELRLPHVAINPGYRPTDLESLKRHGIAVLLMPESGHFLMMEDPTRFNPLLQDAIDQILAMNRRGTNSA